MSQAAYVGGENNKIVFRLQGSSSEDKLTPEHLLRYCNSYASSWRVKQRRFYTHPQFDRHQTLIIPLRVFQWKIQIAANFSASAVAICAGHATINSAAPSSLVHIDDNDEQQQTRSGLQQAACSRAFWVNVNSIFIHLCVHKRRDSTKREQEWGSHNE